MADPSTVRHAHRSGDVTGFNPSAKEALEIAERVMALPVTSRFLRHQYYERIKTLPIRDQLRWAAAAAHNIAAILEAVRKYLDGIPAEKKAGRDSHPGG